MIASGASIRNAVCKPSSARALKWIHQCWQTTTALWHTDDVNSPETQSPGSLHPAGSAIRGVPAGCQEIPGYILDVFDGSAWITQDGRVTDKWHERGVWPTPEAAKEMMHRCLSIV